MINTRGLGRPIPTPILQRLSGIATDLKVLKLLLDEVSPDDYRDDLKSRDPVKLKDRVYPLERAFEIASNYVVELIELGLKELDIAPIDGPRDIDVFVAERIISARLGERLVTIQRGRNMLTHGYPDLRASVVYEGAEELVNVLPRFITDYHRWLVSIGYVSVGSSKIDM